MPANAPRPGGGGPARSKVKANPNAQATGKARPASGRSRGALRDGQTEVRGKKAGGGAMVSARCPSCRHAFRIGAEMAGEDVKCPKCGKLFEVPIDAPLTTSSLGDLADLPSKPVSRVVRRSPDDEGTEVDLEAKMRREALQGKTRQAAAKALKYQSKPSTTSLVEQFGSVDVPFPPASKEERNLRELGPAYRSAIHRAFAPKPLFWLPIALLGAVVGARLLRETSLLGALVGAGVVLVIVLLVWGLTRWRTATAYAAPADVLAAIPLGEWRFVKLRWATNAAALSAAQGVQVRKEKRKIPGLYQAWKLMRASSINYARPGDTVWLGAAGADSKKVTVLPFRIAHSVAQGLSQPLPNSAGVDLPCPKCRGNRIGAPWGWPFRLLVVALVLLVTANLVGATLIGVTHLGVAAPATIAAAVGAFVLALTALAMLWPPIGCDACRLRGKLKVLGRWTWTERLVASVLLGYVALVPFGFAVDAAGGGVTELDRVYVGVGLEAETDEAPAPALAPAEAAYWLARVEALEQGLDYADVSGPTNARYQRGLKAFLTAAVNPDAETLTAEERERKLVALRQVHAEAQALERVGRAAPTLWKGVGPDDERLQTALPDDVQATAVNAFDPLRVLLADTLGVDTSFWAKLLPAEDRGRVAGAP